jgi:hypothetical protein
VSAAAELLHRLLEIGANVELAGDNLILRTGTMAVPAELVRQLRTEKVAVVAALAASSEPRDEAWWRRELVARTAHWLVGGRAFADAQRLAFNQLEVEWHREHRGHRGHVPRSHCAGCGQPIGSRAAFDLGDGNRTHLDRLQCLILYGDRWRDEAKRALIAMGLRPPSEEDAP